MSKQIVQLLEAFAEQAEIPVEEIITEMEQAILSVVQKRRQGSENQIQVTLDQHSGDFHITQQWQVVGNDSDYDAETEMPLDEALKIDTQVTLGQTVTQVIETQDLGRIGAQQAKLLINRVIHDVTRRKVRTLYEQKVGQIVTGRVKKSTRDHVIVELSDQADGIIEKDQLIPREMIRTGDRIRSVVHEVKEDTKGIFILLSRSSPKLLMEAFHVEVPEISEGSIQVKAAARDPGNRAKIAVISHDRRIDPIGACIGIRGSRVQAVSNELNGEKIDIVLWSDNPADFVINALSPVEISSIVMHDDEKKMDIVVSEEHLAKVIGKNGKNIRLAMELTGWELNLLSNESHEHIDPVTQLINQLDVDFEIAEILVRDQFVSLEDILQAGASGLAGIAEFDEEIAEALYQRAQAAKLSQAISEQENTADTDDYLATISTLTDEMRQSLQTAGIQTRENLAELSSDELMEIITLTEEEAAAMILEARQIWFDQD